MSAASKVPWLERYAFGFPSVPSGVGSFTNILGVELWSSAVDVTWNPAGGAVGVGAFALDVYATVASMRVLIASFTLTSAVQRFGVRGAVASSWDLQVRRLAAGSYTPSAAGQQPSFSAIAHGREYSS
jgi:hypothetical protein